MGIVNEDAEFKAVPSRIHPDDLLEADGSFEGSRRLIGISPEDVTGFPVATGKGIDEPVDIDGVVGLESVDVVNLHLGRIVHRFKLDERIGKDLIVEVVLGKVRVLWIGFLHRPGLDDDEAAIPDGEGFSLGADGDGPDGHSDENEIEGNENGVSKDLPTAGPLGFLLKIPGIGRSRGRFLVVFLPGFLEERLAAPYHIPEDVMVFDPVVDAFPEIFVVKEEEGGIGQKEKDQDGDGYGHRDAFSAKS